jgi:retron-type reverse transcriptase
MATKPNPAQTRLQERQYEVTVPCVADRIAQTVVAARPEKAVEPVFHPGSYRYRPGKSQLDAVAACRKRCWRKDWLTDLDAEKFFDSVRGDLIIKAVAAHTDLPWVVLYVRRWLAVPLQLPGGSCWSGTGEPRRAAYVQLNINRLMSSAGLCAASS